MLTFSWRRLGSASALALTLVVVLPALAQAQLFPNLWIQRKRSECVNEPPFYGHVRRDFYGYYPTCWRRFPEGWGCPCPNPDLPNYAASLADRKPDKLPELPPGPGENLDTRSPTGAGRDDAGTDPGAGPGAAPAPRGGNRPAGDPFMPAVPDGNGSPFDRNLPRPVVPDPDGVDPLLPPAAARRPAAPANPAAPGGSPFDPTGPGSPRSSTGNLAPGLDAPAAGSSASLTGRPGSELSDDATGPVLALPEMTPPSGSLPALSPVVSSLPPSLPTNGSFIEPTNPPTSDPATQPAATQAPRRPSLIGGLFNGQGLFRRR